MMGLLFLLNQCFLFSLKGNVLQWSKGESRGLCGDKGVGQWDNALSPGVYLHKSSPPHTLKCPRYTRGCQSISGKMTQKTQNDFINKSFISLLTKHHLANTDLLVIPSVATFGVTHRFTCTLTKYRISENINLNCDYNNNCLT